MTDARADRASTAFTRRLLDAPVHVRGASRPFGELTADDVSSRAQELRDAVGWGPTARVAPVAQAWRELSMTMSQAGATTVGQLAPESLVELGPRLWIVPPSGSLLP